MLWMLRLIALLLVVRWAHTEISIYAPAVGSTIDQVVERVSIPPHTDWPIYPHIEALKEELAEEDLEQFAQSVNERIGEVPQVFGKTVRGD